MHDISATCPLCRTTGEYGAELIGRYTLCPACRGRFYIEVPPLGDQPKPVLSSGQIALGDAARPTTLDDLLWDTQQGNRFVIQSLWRLERRLTWQGYGMVTLLVLLLSILTKLVAR
jgi:hypothetical protein